MKNQKTKFTVTEAAAELNCDPRTLSRRLRAAGIVTPHGGTVTLAQIVKAHALDYSQSRARLAEAQTRRIEVELTADFGDVVPQRFALDCLETSMSHLPAEIAALPRNYLISVQFPEGPQRTECEYQLKAAADALQAGVRHVAQLFREQLRKGPNGDCKTDCQRTRELLEGVKNSLSVAARVELAAALESAAAQEDDEE